MAIKLPPPPATWPFNTPPPDPSAFLRVCEILARERKGSIDDFIHLNSIAWLQTCIRGSNRPLLLRVDAALSIINRLSAKVWLDWLILNPAACIKIGDIVLQMIYRGSLKEEESYKVRASLIARRLIQLISYGVEDTSAHSQFRLLGEDQMIPPKWGDPIINKDALIHVQFPAWINFHLEIAKFWNKGLWHTKDISKIEELEEMELRSERNQNFSLSEVSEGMLRLQGKPPSSYFAEYDDQDLEVKLTTSGMRCLAATSAMQSQLAPSFREVQPALRILEQISTLMPALSSLNDSTLRDTVLMAIIVLLGVPAQDLLHFGIGGNMTVAGRITESSIYLNLGSGFYQSMLGRVDQQELILYLPDCYASLLTEFMHRFSGKMLVSDCFEGLRLSALTHHMAVAAKTTQKNIKFLHRAFIYTARMRVKVPPGILALLLGRPVSPYRAASSYQKTGNHLLYLDNIQCSLLELASLSATSSSWARPGQDKGVDAPSLREAVEIALAQLALVSDINEVAAALDLILSFHGRRYTIDRPSLLDSVTHSPMGMAFIFADKNHGLHRRLRLFLANRVLTELLTER